MQVILSNREFEQAMSCWLSSQGFDVSKYDISVKITAGRGDNAGTTANVTLTELPEKSFAPTAYLSNSNVEEAEVILPASSTLEEPTIIPSSGLVRPFFGSGE